MRSTALIVTSTFLTGLALAPAWGQGQTVDGKQVLTARYADAAPVIDGQMTVGEWNAAAVVQVDFDSPTTAPGISPSYMFLPPVSRDDLSFAMYALYDDEYLYVAVRVTDDFVIHDSPPGAPMYDDDCVHLQFDGDREVDPQAEWGAGIEWNDVHVDTNGDAGCIGCDYFGATFEWESAPGLIEGGYAIEVRISLSSIDVVDGPDTAPPAPGDYIGFNVTLEDDDNGGEGYNTGNAQDPSDNYGRWTSNDAWNDSSNWGLLYFEPRQATAVGAASWGMLKQSR